MSVSVVPQEACVEFADVAWIDFSKGCTEGYVRCRESGGAQKLLEGLTAAGGQLNGADSVFRVLKGMGTRGERGVSFCTDR